MYVAYTTPFLHQAEFSWEKIIEFLLLSKDNLLTIDALVLHDALARFWAGRFLATRGGGEIPEPAAIGDHVMIGAGAAGLTGQSRLYYQPVLWPTAVSG